MQWKNVEPEFVIDISEFLDKKIEACMAFKTQFYDPDSKEPETPITSKTF
jgi:LmbE family N-acetylglucosaminyl deacetylase